MKKSAASVGSIEEKSKFISINLAQSPRKSWTAGGGERDERKLKKTFYWERIEAIIFWEENLLSRLTNRYLVNS